MVMAGELIKTTFSADDISAYAQAAGMDPEQPACLKVVGLEPVWPDYARIVGVDLVWVNDNDPEARAAYSSNPGFTAGTENYHPIKSAEDCLLLTEPGIALALEQMRRHRSGQSARTESVEDPLDARLVLDGFSWLKRNPSGSSLSPEEVADSSTSFRNRLQRQQRAQARSEAAGAIQAEKARRKASRRAREIENMAERSAEIAEVEQQLTQTAQVINDVYPGFDFEGLWRLARLSSGDDDTAKKRKAFQQAARARVNTYLEDPEQLINDMSILILGPELLEANGLQEAYPIAHEAMGRMYGSLTELIQKRSHGNLTDKVIDRWVAAMKTVASPDDLPPKRQRFEEAMNEPNPEQVKVVKKFGRRAATALKALVESRVLQHSLISIAQESPARFIDRLYAFGYSGLDPTNDFGFRATAGIIADCLKNYLANAIFITACSVGTGRVGEQALDLQRSLALYTNLKGSQIVNRNSIKQVGIEELTAIVQEIGPLPKNMAAAIGSFKMMRPVKNESTIEERLRRFHKAKRRWWQPYKRLFPNRYAPFNETTTR